jgi:hypothetical protein
MSLILAIIAIIIAVIGFGISIKANKKANIARGNTLQLHKKYLKTHTEIKQNYSSLTGMGQRILSNENKIDLLEAKMMRRQAERDRMPAPAVQEEDLADAGLTTAEARLMKILKGK